MRRISRDGEAAKFFGGLQGVGLGSRRVQLIEALRGDRTLAELASRHKGHPNPITKWKRQASEGMVDVFSARKGARDGSHDAEVKDLHAKIGELTAGENGCDPNI